MPAPRRTAAQKASDVLAQATEHETLELAYLAAQREMPAVQRDQINPHFARAGTSKGSYAGLESVLPTVLEVANRHGLFVVQLPSRTTDEQQSPALMTKIVHAKTGAAFEATTRLVLDKQNSQGVGSALTYMRRYALVSAFGIVTEADDDGNVASQLANRGSVAHVPQQSSGVSETGAGVAADSGLGGPLPWE